MVTFGWNLIEPGVIIGLFTIGTVVNRRTYDKTVGYTDDAEKRIVDCEAREIECGRQDLCLGNEARSYDRRRYLHSRLLAQFPYLMELWYWSLTYWIYQGLRAFTAKRIVGNDEIFLTASNHAIEVLYLERILHIDVELFVQHLVLRQMPWLMPVLSRVYYSHILLGVAFLAYGYTYFSRGQFYKIRRTIALENIIAFCIFTSWRCTPPRLLPEEFGYIDVLHASTANTVWTQNSYRLLIAAMPSLHFANSLFLGWSLNRFSPHWILRVIAPIWPVMMGLTVVATANHYILDAIVGTCVLLAAYRYNRAILILLPLEDLLCSWLRLERPDDDREANTLSSRY